MNECSPTCAPHLMQYCSPECEAEAENPPTPAEKFLNEDGQAWPRVTVILVSDQQKMDGEDQALLGVIKSYEEQQYEGPLDLNIILRPTCDQRLSDDHLRAVGVKQADPGIVMFWDDQTLQAPNHVEVIASEFVEAWPEQVTIKDVDSDRLTACTQGHYMREIYDEVMK